MMMMMITKSCVNKRLLTWHTRFVPSAYWHHTFICLIHFFSQSNSTTFFVSRHLTHFCPIVITNESRCFCHPLPAVCLSPKSRNLFFLTWFPCWRIAALKTLSQSTSTLSNSGNSTDCLQAPSHFDLIKICSNRFGRQQLFCHGL